MNENNRTIFDKALQEKYGYIRFADFETSTAETNYYKETGDSRVNLWVYTSIFDNDSVSIGTNISEFVECIINDVNNTDGKEISIYFHNLKYDSRYIWTYGVRNLGWKIITGGYSAKNVKNGFDEFNTINLVKGEYGNDTVCVSFTGNEMKPCKIDIALPNGKVIHLVDSLSIIPQSIEQLGEVLGIKKHNDETKKDGFYDVEPSDNIYNYPQVYIDYAKRDVIILKNYFFTVFIPQLEQTQDELGIKPEYRLKQIPLTIAGQSIALQRAFLLSKNPFAGDLDDLLRLNGEQELLARRFYLGGLTMFNPLALAQNRSMDKEFPNCVYVDINSSYPYSMTKPLPYGYPISRTELEHKLKEPDYINHKEINTVEKLMKTLSMTENGFDYLTYYHIKVKTAKIKNRNGLYPLQDWITKLNQDSDTFTNCYSSSCIDLLHNFDCYYLDQEWELMQQFYDFDYEIVETFYIKATDFLNTYTKILYRKKSNAPTKGERNTAKLLLNSGYGKYGERSNHNTVYFCINQEHKDYLLQKGTVEFELNLPKKQRFDRKKNKLITKYKPVDRAQFRASKCNIGSQFVGVDDENIFPLQLTRTNRKQEMYYNVWIAATITSYSRCYLLESILKCGNDIGNVLYVDTDSMILKDKTYTKNLKTDDKELGAWKIEEDNVNAVIFGKKLYKLTNNETGKETYKLKGVSGNKPSAVDALMHSSSNKIFALKKQLEKTPSGWVFREKSIQLCSNPIENQMRNSKYLKEIVSLESLDDINRAREILKAIEDSRTVIPYTPTAYSWKELKSSYNLIKDKLVSTIWKVVELNIHNPDETITDKTFQTIILATISNFLSPSDIDKVENINLIDILNKKLNLWKSNKPNRAHEIVSEFMSYSTSGNIGVNNNAGLDFIDDEKVDSEWLWIIFSLPGGTATDEYIVKRKTKNSSRSDVMNWLVDNNIIPSKKESNEFLSFLGWKK